MSISCYYSFEISFFCLLFFYFSTAGHWITRHDGGVKTRQTPVIAGQIDKHTHAHTIHIAIHTKGLQLFSQMGGGGFKNVSVQSVNWLFFFLSYFLFFLQNSSILVFSFISVAVLQKRVANRNTRSLTIDSLLSALGFTNSSSGVFSSPGTGR